MLKAHRRGSSFTVETGGGRLVWDALRGGLITDFSVRNALEQRPLVPPGGVLADVTASVSGALVRLSDGHAEMQVTKRLQDYLVLSTRTRLADGRLEVVQDYEVHEEGAVFVHLAISVSSGAALDLADIAIPVRLKADAQKARWGYYTRQPKYKRDYSTIHAFVGFSLFRALAEGDDLRELLPYVSLDLGWEKTRFFSNRLEFLMEDWTTFGDGPATDTRSQIRTEAGVFQLDWHFHEGRALRVTGPYRYRNRWALIFGRARSERAADSDPAVRNTLLGCRICHCMYPYARLGDRWPWVSMPIKQIPEQPPQLYRGNPELRRVDEAAALGANTMIIHQFWMRNPGSNNEPIADYIPDDRRWLKAFVARCHRAGMRVLFYGRGTEMWQMYSPFFEEFLRPGVDGLYVDWNTPFCMGYVKCSPLHVSAHNYFHFAKALRMRVGPGGALIGHTGNSNLLAYAPFDAAIGGEFSVRHDELLTHPESTAYFAGLDCMGGHLISGNLPDRLLFSSPKAAAVCAAFGMASHPFMEPGVPFAERVAFIKPLWDSLAALKGQVTRLHNPAYIPTRAVSMGMESLYPSLWENDQKQALLLVTNLGDQPASGTIEVERRALEVKRNARLRPLPIEGTVPGEALGLSARVSALPSCRFAAFKLE